MSANIVYAATSGFTCHMFKTLFCHNLNVMPHTDETPDQINMTLRMQKAAKDIGLNSNFSIVFLPHNHQCIQNFGNHCIGAKEIVVNLNTIEQIKGASQFFIYRELFYFKHNTSFLGSLIGLAAAAISSFGLAILLPKTALLIPLLGICISPPVCLATIIGTFAMQVFSGMQERKAERLAWSKCNSQEKKETITHFKKIIQINQKWRNSESSLMGHLYRQLLITGEGNYRFQSLFHHSLTGRIAYFEALPQS